jgi:hypothetical protein
VAPLGKPPPPYHDAAPATGASAATSVFSAAHPPAPQALAKAPDGRKPRKSRAKPKPVLPASEAWWAQAR